VTRFVHFGGLTDKSFSIQAWPGRFVNSFLSHSVYGIYQSGSESQVSLRNDPCPPRLQIQPAVPIEALLGVEDASVPVVVGVDCPQIALPAELFKLAGEEDQGMV